MNKETKEIKKNEADLKKARQNLRDEWGNTLKNTKVEIVKGLKVIEISFKTLSLAETVLTKRDLKNIGIDVEKNVFNDIIKLESEKDGENENFEINNMILNKYIYPFAIEKALMENISEETNNGKVNVVFDKENKNFKTLNNILNRFLDSEEYFELSDNFPESTILNILVIGILYLATPS